MAVARILDRFDQRYRAIGQLPHGSDHFRMARVTNQDHMAAKTLMAHGLLVHLGDKGQVASR